MRLHPCKLIMISFFWIIAILFCRFGETVQTRSETLKKRLRGEEIEEQSLSLEHSTSRRRYDENDLSTAILNGKLKAAKKIVKKRGCMAFLENDSTPLSLIVEMKKTDFIQDLIFKKCTDDVQVLTELYSLTHWDNDLSGLIHTFFKENSEVCLRVLENLIKVGDYETIVSFILSPHLDLSRDEIDGKNFLTVAIENDRVDLVEFLIKDFLVDLSGDMEEEIDNSDFADIDFTAMKLLGSRNDDGSVPVQYVKSVQMASLIGDLNEIAYTFKGSNPKTTFETLVADGKREIASALSPLETRIQNCIYKIQEKDDKNFAINVTRNNVFKESFEALDDELSEWYDSYPKISVTFNGEDGYDAGGLRREFISLVFREIFHGNPEADVKPLFEVVDFESQFYAPTTHYPKKYFKYAGSLVAFALTHHISTGVTLIPAITERICGIQTLTEEMFSQQHPTIYNGLKNLRKEDINFDGMELYLDDEETIPVTRDNLELFIRKTKKEMLYQKYQSRIDAFVKGFKRMASDLFKKHLTPEELSEMIRGQSELSAESLIAVINCQNSSHWSQFKTILREFTNEQRKMFLKFATGLDILPMHDSSFMLFVSFYQARRQETLPSAATCSKTVSIPKYDSIDIMREKLLYAIAEAIDFRLR